MQAHLATEKYLASIAYPETQGGQKPFSFTAIREGIYSESFPMYTGFIDVQNPRAKLKIPHDGSGPGIAWAKIEDLGEATARLVQSVYISTPDAMARYKDKCVVLSGSKAWSIAEVVELLSQIVGRETKVQSVSVEDYVQEKVVQEQLQSHGPGEVPRQWATSFQAIKAGETAVVTDELERLLGRKPEDFETTLRGMMNS